MNAPPTMSSFNPIAQSLLHFYTGKYESSLHQINLHFTLMGKSSIIEPALDLYEIYKYPFAKWEYFFQRYLNFHWSGNVPVHEIYNEVFLHAPFKKLPKVIAQLYIPYFCESDEGQDHSFHGSSSSKLEEKRLEELAMLLENVCSTGLVLRADYDDPCGIFPVIDNEFLTLLERFQGNTKYKYLVKAAIESGLKKAPSMSQKQVADEHFETIAKIFFQEWFLPSRCIPFKANFLPRFAKLFPDRKSLVLASLRNYMDSIGSEQELFDFMHIFSGGVANPSAPRASLSRIIHLLENERHAEPFTI